MYQLNGSIFYLALLKSSSNFSMSVISVNHPLGTFYFFDDYDDDDFFYYYFINIVIVIVIFIITIW